MGRGPGPGPVLKGGQGSGPGPQAGQVRVLPEGKLGPNIFVGMADVYIRSCDRTLRSR
jgi:hypothetical protein